MLHRAKYLLALVGDRELSQCVCTACYRPIKLHLDTAYLGRSLRANRDQLFSVGV